MGTTYANATGERIGENGLNREFNDDLWAVKNHNHNVKRKCNLDFK